VKGEAIHWVGVFSAADWPPRPLASIAENKLDVDAGFMPAFFYREAAPIRQGRFMNRPRIERQGHPRRSGPNLPPRRGPKRGDGVEGYWGEILMRRVAKENSPLKRGPGRFRVSSSMSVNPPVARVSERRWANQIEPRIPRL
jgi:hypothetical protein